MNYRQMSDSDLQAAWRGVTDELNRRTTLAAAPGELDAYPQDWTVTHDGRTWTSRTHCNTTEPGQGESWEQQPTPDPAED